MHVTSVPNLDFWKGDKTNYQSVNPQVKSR